MSQKRLTYETTAIALKDRQQLRITVGRRTVFVYANLRGLHVRDSGYSKPDKRSKGGTKRPKQMDLPL